MMLNIEKIMVRLRHERVLVIGDSGRDVESALLEAAPAAQVTSVPTLFDGIAELSSARFTAILAAAEPLERRPEAAVREIRRLAGEAKFLLFGHPTLEILSRKMIEFGCDDYLITPASSAEFQQLFSQPTLRLTSADSEDRSKGEDVAGAPGSQTAAMLARLPIADLALDALLAHPHDALVAALKQINEQLSPGLEMRFSTASQSAPEAPEGRVVVSQPLRSAGQEMSSLHLLAPADEDQAAIGHGLLHCAAVLGKTLSLQERHNQLQRLAITDELTGLHNCRYFRHFLSRIIERARAMHFPVTLLLFDIDDFKKYNDQFGHGTGDEILKEAATLMRRCTRQHDLVARIGGDEFAVVFWEKEGPRQPREPKPGAPSRPPQEPLQVFERFKGLISSEEFPLLGQTGKGVLTVSAGMAAFPWDAPDAESLIKEADRRLMMGAKRSGKNTVFIVGTDDPTSPPQAS